MIQKSGSAAFEAQCIPTDSTLLGVSTLIGPGGICGELLPGKTGIYRFQISAENKSSAGEVIYIGKVGGEKGKDRHLRPRIGEFIGAAMGFEIPGGISFWGKGNRHKRWVQDLEVRVFQTDDPTCAELTAFKQFHEKTGKTLPRLNKILPRKKCRNHGE